MLWLPQGPAKGLGKVRFHDYDAVFGGYELPSVRLFREQIAVFKECVSAAPQNDAQRKDLDFLMTIGDIFALMVYGQLILENARIYETDDDLLDQIFEVLVRDFARFAVDLHGKPITSAQQMEYCMRMIKKPAVDDARYEQVWKNHVYALKGAYEMNP